MRSLRAIALPGLLVLSACVSTAPPIQPDSLVDFRNTLVQLDAKAAEAMTVEYEWSYRNFKRSVKEDEDLDPRNLALQFCSGSDADFEFDPDSGFDPDFESDLDSGIVPDSASDSGSVFDTAWGSCDVDSKTSPVFMVIADSRQSLGQLNQMMVDYASFLVLFNDANNETRSSLESAAGRIGDSAQSIAGKFEKSFDEARFGAFATIGVNIVEQLLAKKQKDGMAAVLADFHPGVQAFAELGSEAMENSAIGIKDEYLEDRKPLMDAIVKAKDDPARRLEQVERLIALNEQTTGQLDVLASLSAAYQSLPGAHAELISALQSGYRASLSELVAHIDAIGSAYQTLHASDSN